LTGWQPEVLFTLILTPGQLARRSEFYHQLGQLTAAGIGLVRALEQLERSPPARSYREPIRRLLIELGGGFTLSESLRRLGHWLPSFDIALLHAGEQSGRLDACFKVLSNYYNERAQVARQLIADLAYPLFLFHFAIFIFPFVQLFISGNWLRYLGQTFGVVLPLYLLVGLVLYATQSRHGEGWRAAIESFLSPVPMLGTARRYLALSRLAGALEALLSAGVLIVQAWELAATASGSPALRRTVHAWRPELDAGRTPPEVVNTSRRFPELFANQYATGEVSGKLDETLGHLHRYYQEEGSRKLRTFARVVPRGFYMLVMVLIAVWVIRWWSGYFKMIGNAGGF
jgi:type II secretory pathway component PulF